MRPTLLIVGIAAVVVSAQSPAPTPTSPSSGFPAVDSATVARVAGARATAAFRAGDLAAARREIERATRAWPVQPAYHWARAIIAAHARDTAGTLDALRDYTALGMGRDLGDSALAALARAPVFAAVVQENARNRAPLSRSLVRLSMDDSTFWPEGADFDPRTRHYYVTSIRQRTIAEVDGSGRARLLWPRDRADMGAMMGVRVDTARGILWATTSGVRQMEAFAPPDTEIAALLRIRLRDGVVEHRWNVPPVPGGHVLGDLVVGPKGDVFMTDSNQPVVYRLRPSSDSLEAVRHPLFRSLQGLAPTPDARFLYLSDYSHGLLRVDLASGAVIRLADAPHSTSVGCDGIAWDRGAIVAVQNGVTPARVMRFVLDATGTRVARAELLDRNTPIADEPTIGTVVGREFIYVANGQWDKHDEAGNVLPGRTLARPVLLAVPLPDADTLAQRRDSLARLVLASIAGRENEPAEAVFKNIKTLRTVPAGRLPAIMNIGLGKSLGVDCLHCHVAGAWESDDKPQKQIARDMFQMVNTINTQLLANIPNLRGPQPIVNCTTCHRGSIKPALDMP